MRDLSGTGQVYRFTLSQLLKSNANRITLLLMVLLAAVSMPLTALMRGESPEVSDTSSLTAVRLENRTAVPQLASSARGRGIIRLGMPLRVRARAYSIACSWLGKVARYSMVLPPLGILGLCPIPYYAKSAPLPCPAPGWAMPHRMRKYSTCFCRWGVVQ